MFLEWFSHSDNPNNWQGKNNRRTLGSPNIQKKNFAFTTTKRPEISTMALKWCNSKEWNCRNLRHNGTVLILKPTLIWKTVLNYFCFFLNFTHNSVISLKTFQFPYFTQFEHCLHIILLAKIGFFMRPSAVCCARRQRRRTCHRFRGMRQGAARATTGPGPSDPSDQNT